MNVLRSAVLAAASLAAACHGDGTIADDLAGRDPSASLFDPDVLLEVEIELDPADWDVLRHQERNLVDLLSGDCLAEPFDSPFTWFPATVGVDGEVLPEVAVSKKGLLGSMSDTKPSLRLDFDRYVDGRSLRGLERLVLNNAVQDPSLVHQCLAYGFFQAAGVPASRCSYARVAVNGADLGVYVTVEAVREPMLARHFEDPTGNLYEGTLSDFREGWTGTFDPDSGDGADGSDLHEVVDALGADDGSLLQALDPVVDVDAFLTYWAAEVLVGQWDGYASNLNNYYLYHDPTSGRFRFLPWGVDGTLDRTEPFGEGRPVSVVANGVLAHRLYAIPEARDRYLERLLYLLDHAWDEDHLLAEVDRMEALVAPAVDPQQSGGVAEAMEEVREVIRGRREAVVEDRGT